MLIFWEYVCDDVSGGIEAGASVCSRGCEFRLKMRENDCFCVQVFMLARSARNLLSSSKHTFRFRGCLFAKYASTATTDDRAIVTLFDSPHASTFRYPASTSTGLFGHAQLSHPNAFITLADATLIRAQLLTNRILNARSSRDELLKVVKNLDRLSDMLCSVIDLAELIRNAHPDKNWIAAANHAYEKLCEFMNVLNTHVGLYEVSCDLLMNTH